MSHATRYLHSKLPKKILRISWTIAFRYFFNHHYPSSSSSAAICENWTKKKMNHHRIWESRELENCPQTLCTRCKTLHLNGKLMLKWCSLSNFSTHQVKHTHFSFVHGARTCSCHAFLSILSRVRERERAIERAISTCDALFLCNLWQFYMIRYKEESGE